MVKYVLERSESKYKAEVRQFLMDYYLPHLKVLIQMVSEEGGETIVQVFLEELRKTALEHNWPLQFNYQTVLAGEYPLGILREALPVLLERGKQFASRVTDPKNVDERMNTLKMQFGGAVHADLQRCLEGEED